MYNPPFKFACTLLFHLIHEYLCYTFNKIIRPYISLECVTSKASTSKIFHIILMFANRGRVHFTYKHIRYPVIYSHAKFSKTQPNIFYSTSLPLYFTKIIISKSIAASNVKAKKIRHTRYFYLIYLTTLNLLQLICINLCIRAGFGFGSPYSLLFGCAFTYL